MQTTNFIEYLNGIDVDFFTGVPDSQLQPLCNYLIKSYGISKKHIIAANEGNAVAIAAGYHLSTGKISCVYLQNSGLGNVVNPIASLLNDNVYGIPSVFVVGWRGEPNVHDEPQHAYQGKITLELLELMDIAYMVLDNQTSEKEVEEKLSEFRQLLAKGKSVAFVVKKGGLSYNENIEYNNGNQLTREEIIQCITNAAKEDIVVSTTGKASRELFEIREQSGHSHKYDFLTVGSMGHSSSIALGVALNKPETRVWCIDGDGSILMHMGSMAVIGAISPRNYVHIVVNNSAHESVGGMPTVAETMNLVQVALGCGYKSAYTVDTHSDLCMILTDVGSQDGPAFIEVKSAIGARDDLGRPTNTPLENKLSFMTYLNQCK